MAYHYENIKLEKGMYGRSGRSFSQTLEELRELKASGIRCVASTTARSVVENADGTRTSDFDVVRFRDYE